MAEDDPRRLDEIRKYAAIYGRFDCKRKPEKPLTLHEVSKGFEGQNAHRVRMKVTVRSKKNIFTASEA